MISRRAADRLRAGHVWVYASDVQEVLAPELTPIPGLLPVVDGRGMPLGTALWSPASQIALRLVSRDVLTEDEQWIALLESRVRRALHERRTMLAEAGEGTDACRLVFSEADELPGTGGGPSTGELIVLQILARGPGPRRGARGGDPGVAGRADADVLLWSGEMRAYASWSN